MTGAYLRGENPPEAPLNLTQESLYPDLEATYLAMAELLRRTPTRWAGWKLGGTNHASREAFGVDELYYGALSQREIMAQPARAPGMPLADLRGEVELALRIGANGVSHDAWCVALEMPSSPITDMPGLGVRALVADRCAAGALLLGPEQGGPLPAACEMVLEQDGVVLDHAGLENLVAPVAEIFADFLHMGQAHGLPLAPGQWVATGGITSCCDFAEGSRVRVLMDGAMVLEFTATRAARS
ncbi:MAG TPA: hypothetical protein ENK63_01520 [Rhodobacterales bacterium]|nr:hypothetical protein [Rhodobacterales bacterium]